jgi:hypothetical protein
MHECHAPSGIRRSWIFLYYSIHMTTKPIYPEYSDIYLEYVNPFPIPGICLEYAWHILSESFQVYVWNIPSIFFPSHLVICLEYTWIIPLLANRPAAAMRLGCCCHSTRILGVKGVQYSAPNVAGTQGNARASAASIATSLLQQPPKNIMTTMMYIYNLRNSQPGTWSSQVNP